jgi:peptide/nickel transport system substrate-binding protein
MKGSFRKPEIASINSVEVVDPATIKLILKTPFSPLLAQLTDRAGMMVSPKAAEAAATSSAEAGLRRSLQVRRARPAGPHRGREVRRLLEQGQVFIDKITYLPIVDARCGWPTCARAAST